MSNYFDRQKGVIGDAPGERIKNTKILVIGAGAGGNEVLKNLALMGFGNFTIVDFDPIEDSNLSRTTLFSKKDIGKPKAAIAAKTLLQVSLHESPSIRGINAKIQDIGKQVFLNHDIVICCVDTMNARAYINDWCVILKKPLFEMAFEKFVVQISFFPNENQTDSCLREIIGFGDFTGRRQSCSNLKMVDSQLSHIPTIQVAAALAGGLIATEVIMVLQNRSQLKNKMLQYAADNHRVNVLDFPQSKNCHLHENVNYQLFHADFDVKKNTFEDLLTELKDKLNSDFYIHWNEEYIYSMCCENCEKKMLIKKFKSNVYDTERWCSACQDKYDDSESVKAKWVTSKELFLTNPNHKKFLSLPMSDFGAKEKDIIVVNILQTRRSKILVLL